MNLSTRVLEQLKLEKTKFNISNSIDCGLRDLDTEPDKLELAKLELVKLQLEELKKANFKYNKSNEDILIETVNIDYNTKRGSLESHYLHLKKLVDSNLSYINLEREKLEREKLELSKMINSNFSKVNLWLMYYK